MIRRQLVFSLATFKVEKTRLEFANMLAALRIVKNAWKPELMLLVLSGQEAGTVKCFVFVEEKLN